MTLEVTHTHTLSLAPRWVLSWRTSDVLSIAVKRAGLSIPG